MADQILPLADAYEPVTHQDWLDAVDHVLRGRSIDRLRTRLDDGIVVEPLYTADDARSVGQWPGQDDRRRGNTPAGLTAGWDIRQAHSLVGDAAVTNEAVLADLTRGVTSIELSTDGLDARVLDRVLTGVYLDLAPIGLVGHGDGLAAAEMLLALAADRGVPASEFRADLGCDPIGAAVRDGGIGAPLDEAISAVATFAVATRATHPHVRAIRVDGGPYAVAGAAPSTEIAVVVATGVEWLRAVTAAGLDAAAAASTLQLVITVGTDQFGDIAKLRALRVVWTRVLEASGAADAETSIQASMSPLVLSVDDPWVNMLRGTIACFSAAVGGASTVQVAPFDSAIGVADELGMRVARNTQLVLMEESNLHKVIDPAGGSWYVESLTDALADTAWERFREIEAEGGIVASLRAGALQHRIETSWEGIARDIATRRRPITGVSEFPDLEAAPVVRAARPAPRVAAVDPEIRPLTAHRLSESFESLRRGAALAVERPRVFLAALGPPAIHSARAGWATNAFAAGGIAAVATPGFDDDVALGEAFAASGCRLAVICSSDAVYAERAATAAAALKSAGVTRLYLAGDPGDRRATDMAAGVDEFVHVGVDLVDVLQRAHRTLGLDAGPETLGGEA